MSSYESLHNDVRKVVQVWFPDCDGPAACLLMSLETVQWKFPLNLTHHICVVQEDICLDEKGRTEDCYKSNCLKVSSPVLADEVLPLNVSQIAHNGDKNLRPGSMTTNLCIRPASQKNIFQETFRNMSKAEFTAAKDEAIAKMMGLSLEAGELDEDVITQKLSEVQIHDEESQESEEDSEAAYDVIEDHEDEEAFLDSDMLEELVQDRLQEWQNAKGTEELLNARMQIVNKASEVLNSTLNPSELAAQYVPEAHFQRATSSVFGSAYLMLALVGIKMLRGFQTPRPGWQEPLINTR
eukprot:gnl/MRDRNA2_/MRDRNA2_205532_c0_seq1.p1 gnl/MRDRNA2_/MRDRNA2_205532_c0~~gnl/MRDRNA2_/MRDRNA2_205532_c0_seq1.p1  ORF type:complete len:296 (-),score=57.44 gnl/MRDRNA2_/MRDRNA2_205532_c0_seq1:168-1055(-)